MGRESGPTPPPLLPHHRQRARRARNAARRLGAVHRRVDAHCRSPTRMTSHLMTFDPRAEVRRHLATAGIDLPDATVDELVAYLEDLHAAALEDGAGAADAKRRA